MLELRVYVNSSFRKLHHRQVAERNKAHQKHMEKSLCIENVDILEQRETHGNNVKHCSELFTFSSRYSFCKIMDLKTQRLLRRFKQKLIREDLSVSDVLVLPRERLYKFLDGLGFSHIDVVKISSKLKEVAMCDEASASSNCGLSDSSSAIASEVASVLEQTSAVAESCVQETQSSPSQGQTHFIDACATIT